jgi:hypothetical protein
VREVPGPGQGRAYGIGQWQLERILSEAPAAYWAHPEEIGLAFQQDRRAVGKPLQAQSLQRHEQWCRLRCP